MLVALFSCRKSETVEVPRYSIEKIAESHERWTGVAAFRDGRIFVSYPRWSVSVEHALCEIINGRPVPWPDSETAAYAGGMFSNIQSVYAGGDGSLWVLDNGAPFYSDTNTPPVIYRFDHASGKLADSFEFGPEVYTPESYFNDLRSAEGGKYLFITDSGRGGIIGLDLRSRGITRLIENHGSVEAETDTLTVGGREIKLKIHADGLAVNSGYLYYSALSGHTLFRVRMKTLIDYLRRDVQVPDHYIEEAGVIPACDGMEFDRYGRLLITAVEKEALYLYREGDGVDNITEGMRLSWPDSVSYDGGSFYVTTSGITYQKKGNIFLYKLTESNISKKTR